MVLEEVGVKRVRGKDSVCLIDSLTPNSDKHLISHYNITTESHIGVIRIKEMINNQRNSRSLSRFSSSEIKEYSMGVMHIDARVLRVKGVFYFKS